MVILTLSIASSIIISFKGIHNDRIHFLNLQLFFFQKKEFKLTSKNITNIFLNRNMVIIQILGKILIKILITSYKLNLKLLKFHFNLKL